MEKKNLSFRMLVASVLIVIYMAGGMGFGMHYCAAEDSSHFYTFLSSSDEEDFHAHRTSDGNLVIHSHGCSDCFTDIPGDDGSGVHIYGHCCDDTVHFLEVDQMSESARSVFNVFAVPVECVRQNDDVSVSVPCMSRFREGTVSLFRGGADLVRFVLNFRL